MIIYLCVAQVRCMWHIATRRAYCGTTRRTFSQVVSKVQVAAGVIRQINSHHSSWVFCILYFLLAMLIDEAFLDYKFITYIRLFTLYV